MSFEIKLAEFINQIVVEHKDTEGVGFMRNEYIDDVVTYLRSEGISMEELIELKSSKEYLVSFYAEMAHEELKKGKNLISIQLEINKVKDISSAVYLAQSFNKKVVKEWIMDNRYSEVGEMTVPNLLFITATKMLGLIKS